MLGLTIVLLVCLAVAGGLSCLNSQEGAQSQGEKEELTLKDYPNVFNVDKKGFCGGHK